MANRWLIALKQWNSKHNKTGKYKVPRKGTAEYCHPPKSMDSITY